MSRVADVMTALAAETAIGTALIATGVLLVARGEQVTGSAQAGRAWLVSFRAHGRHRRVVTS